MKPLLFIIGLLLPAYLYLGFRLLENQWEWILLFVPFLTILLFPFRRWHSYQLYFTYASMGFLTYLIVFTIIRDVSLYAFDFYAPASYVYGLTCFCLVVGFLNAYTGPRIKRVRVPVTGLPKELIGFTIAQISDLHVGATIRKSYVERVVRKINHLTPHIVALTGDIGDGDVKIYREDIAPVKKLKPIYGSFFVTGNHEYYWNANEWLIVMNNLGMINLINRGKVVQHQGKSVLVAGIPDPVSRLHPDLIGILKPEASEKADFKILLSHRPGIAADGASHGFNLQLSGHTHGGQFFPWTIVVKMVHKLSRGLHQVNGMWVYVNPGTGSWGPLLRLGTTPEITLLELVLPKIHKRTIAKEVLEP